MFLTYITLTINVCANIHWGLVDVITVPIIVITILSNDCSMSLVFVFIYCPCGLVLCDHPPSALQGLPTKYWFLHPELFQGAKLYHLHPFYMMDDKSSSMI